MRTSHLLGIFAATFCILALSSAKHIRFRDVFVDDGPESRVTARPPNSLRSSEDNYFDSVSTFESIRGSFEIEDDEDEVIEPTQGPSRHRKKHHDNRRRFRRIRQQRKETEAKSDLENEFNYMSPTTSDLLAIAQRHAMKVIVEKMFIAFGPEFIEEKLKVPKNISLLGIPTVASPLNITTEPCPNIYARCSSGIYHSSCDPAPGSNADLWIQRFNFYFDLPIDLLDNTDELLNATVRIYKYLSLPLENSINLTVNIHAYTASFTKKKDWNIVVNSVDVLSDYIGWVTIDITNWARKINPEKNFGFFIKISDDLGYLWNTAEFFEQRNCSNDSYNNHLVPVPFGVATKEPKEKFPSLTIHTGVLDRYYSDRTEEDDEYNYDDFDYYKEDESFNQNEYEDEFNPRNQDEQDPLNPEEEKEEVNLKNQEEYLVDEYPSISPLTDEMSKDDPQALTDDDNYEINIQEADSGSEEHSARREEHLRQVQRIKKKNRRNHQLYVHPSHVLIQRLPEKHPSDTYDNDQNPNVDHHNLSSLEDEDDDDDKLTITKNQIVPDSDVAPKKRHHNKPRHRHNRHADKNSRRHKRHHHHNRRQQ